MSRIIAIANHKGGVGKTTSVASIGAILANKGYKTLLIDLDAQANLTGSFLKAEPEETIYNALRGETELPTITIKPNLSIVASCLDMAGVELDLSSRISREYILHKLLKPIAGKYDYILLDCPPSLGLVTINALVAAKELFIPLTAEALPSRGLAKLTNIVHKKERLYSRGTPLRYGRSKLLSRQQRSEGLHLLNGGNLSTGA